MEKINVALYGGNLLFGGRETPLEAEVVYCSCKERCSFYREGKCLNISSLAGDSCDKGRRESFKGYTSKAKKYSEFRSKYENDEQYSKLKYPKGLFAVIDDVLWFNLLYVSARKVREDDKVDGYSNMITDTGYYLSFYGRHFFRLPIKEATPDVLHSIFSYVPRSSFRVLKEEYQEIVSEILPEMKRLVPDIYAELINKYPEYDREPNYVGKYAYVKTLKDGTTIDDGYGNIGIKNGDKIYCSCFTEGIIPFGGSSAVVEVIIKDTHTIKVLDNSWCDENTRFE